jgi:hypothetical protein
MMNLCEELAGVNDEKCSIAVPGKVFNGAHRSSAWTLVLPPATPVGKIWIRFDAGIIQADFRVFRVRSSSETIALNTA